MDISTVIGLIMGIGLMFWAITGKSDLSTFVDTGSVAIVIGGGISAVLISFPIKNIVGIAKVVKNCFFGAPANPQALIADLVKYAEVARRDGILALENATAEIKDPFLVAGIQMAVDGTDPDQIEAILLSDLESVEARHADGKALFDGFGRYAPAFGMIGTLIGERRCRVARSRRRRYHQP